jgi:hypothetical protein
MDGRELKAYEGFKAEAQCLRGKNHHLRLELQVGRAALYRAERRIAELEARVAQLTAEKQALQAKLADLTARLDRAAAGAPVPAPPAWVKANRFARRPRRPGRPPGHAPALRPPPARIDAYVDVPLPTDAAGRAVCPHCHGRLRHGRRHRRLVEDLLLPQVWTTCYRTASGYCPRCRRRVEARAPEQPPAANLPHAQVGLHALATAALLRVRHRLPFRQVAAVLGELLKLPVCPGALARQLQRVAAWLEPSYGQIQVALRHAAVVHADETSWRTAGRNGQLWTLTNAAHTLYHVDPSRGAAVIAGLLGSAFGNGADGREQTLVSDFYAVYDQFPAAQQKCLAHLLREFHDVQAQRPELQEHRFFRRAGRLVQEMLGLKRRQGTLAAAAYQHQVALLEQRLAALSQTTWDDPDAARLTARLAKYRLKLTTFLHRAEVDATNNAAERALRPAVVMRKVTGGSRSAAGAKAWAMVASLVRTAQQQGRAALTTLEALLQAAWAGTPCALLAPVVAGSDTS